MISSTMRAVHGTRSSHDCATGETQQKVMGKQGKKSATAPLRYRETRSRFVCLEQKFHQGRTRMSENTDVVMVGCMLEILLFLNVVCRCWKHMDSLCSLRSVD